MAELADHPRRSFADMVGPSVGEQVLLLAIGGELDTAFVLPGIFPTITQPRQPRRMRGMWCSPTALLWSMSRKPVH